MEELQAALKVLLANVYVMYYKAHSSHWNVEGSDFRSKHLFFGEIYEDVYDSIDPIAEHMRVLDTYVPSSLASVIKYASIPESDVPVADSRQLVVDLQYANAEVIGSLNKVFSVAQQHNNQGLMNFIADRIDVHSKHEWMMRSILK